MKILAYPVFAIWILIAWIRYKITGKDDWGPNVQ